VNPQQAAARAKGPLVWRDMDQAALDAAYDQDAYASNREQVVGRFTTNSELVRQRIGAPKRLSYGPTPIEGIDLYSPQKTPAPVLVYIHGGAWRRGLARDYGFPAEMFVNAGVHYAALDFANVDELNGDLFAMADQVKRGVAWAFKNAASYGGDPARFYVCGQSSGGHLASVVVTTDWQKEFGLQRDFIKAAVLGSGMYDLEPVRLSHRSSYVKFTNAMVEELSAIRHIDRITCPLIVTYGTYETPEFIRQARDFAAAVEAAGKPVKLIVGEGYNHFEMGESIANPYGVYGLAALEMMGLRQRGA